MGCECSQANSIGPQQPHPVNLDQHTPQAIQVPVKIQTVSIPQQNQSQDKENVQQTEVKRKSHKDGTKAAEQKLAVSQTKIKSKSQKRKSEIPIIDSTNLVKKQTTNEPKQKEPKQEKKVTARSEYKIEDQPSVGPSCKSIEVTQPLKEQNKNVEATKVVEQTPIEPENGEKLQVQEIRSTGQLHQNDSTTHSKSKRKIKSVKQVHQSRKVSEKLQDKQQFVLEHWEKREEGQSRTERLKKIEEMQIEREEVGNYLNQVWDYEKQLLDNVIAKLESHQLKKYEHPAVATQ